MPDGKPYRCMRGGSWFNGEFGHGRVSNRNPGYFRGPQDPNHPYYHIGFRVARPGVLGADHEGIVYQVAQLLAQQGNFQILLIGRDANRRQHIQDQADETVEQCEDHTDPMPK